ncbi:hypothetical protein SDRG_04688 [Saprolegnia diclina VS20]|uniref:Uncharacterized protein n=1 Tax=Saprolegnia diclina (strain VS20) TaxID=1156394 RepID=T0S042_SAPDV|nr:hypothetical protein SDRG_04688 [Saprolegnia diclina VS20]EQC38263.1 hypothetical protein SDRG_04688 [Saprolegnia diclina VS20]|eukprot:XP_008608590.1 hypothetical protein SDRG_04688 [Saprolegnia diclina VS20]
MSLYDPLYYHKRAAKLAEAKLVAEDGLMRKPRPTAAANQGSRATAFGRSTTPTVVPQHATAAVPVTVARAVECATDDSVDANARHDGGATSDGKQPQLDHRRAASHTGDERRDCLVKFYDECHADQRGIDGHD